VQEKGIHGDIPCHETHMFYKHKHSGNKMPNMWVPSYHWKLILLWWKNVFNCC